MIANERHEAGLDFLGPDVDRYGWSIRTTRVKPVVLPGRGCVLDGCLFPVDVAGQAFFSAMVATGYLCFGDLGLSVGLGLFDLTLEANCAGFLGDGPMK